MQQDKFLQIHSFLNTGFHLQFSPTRSSFYLRPKDSFDCLCLVFDSLGELFLFFRAFAFCFFFGLDSGDFDRFRFFSLRFRAALTAFEIAGTLRTLRTLSSLGSKIADIISSRTLLAPGHYYLSHCTVVRHQHFFVPLLPQVRCF